MRVSIVAAVSEAITLNQEINAKKKRLDDLKVFIREAALKARDKSDLERVEFASPEGVATVAFPHDKLFVIKGADPRALRDKLPPSTWDMLFVEELVVSLAGCARDAFDALKGPYRKAALEVLATETATPTVILPK